MKFPVTISLLAFLSFFLPAAARADCFQFNDDHPFRHHELLVVADYLEENSVLPLSWDYAKELSRNLLVAQREADLDQPDSLANSEQAVLGSIRFELEDEQMGIEPKGCCNVIVWAQSQIAIDDFAHATLGPNLDFGLVPVVPQWKTDPPPPVVTPEPSTFVLLLTGIALLGGVALWKRSNASC